MDGVRLADLADVAGGDLVCGSRGDAAADLRIAAVRALESAGEGHLSFVRSVRFAAAARESAASAFVVPEELRGLAADDGRPCLVADNPDLAVVRILEHLHPAPELPAGVHPTAVVDPGASVEASVHVGPYAVIGAGAAIGARSVIHAHAVVGNGCRLGEDVVLHPHVVLYAGTVLGDRVEIHAGSIIGGDGFGYTTHGGVHHKIPQVGIAVLEDDVAVGALSAVDRAALEETRIGRGTKIDNLVQVGHNVTTGKGCFLCGCAAIAGSSKLGNYVVMAGGSGVADHLTISDGVQVAAMSLAVESYEPGQVIFGQPAVPIRQAHRQTAGLRRLDDMRKRLRALEKQVEKLTSQEEREP